LVIASGSARPSPPAKTDSVEEREIRLELRRPGHKFAVSRSGSFVLGTNLRKATTTRQRWPPRWGSDFRFGFAFASRLAVDQRPPLLGGEIDELLDRQLERVDDRNPVSRRHLAQPGVCVGPDSDGVRSGFCS